MTIECDPTKHYDLEACLKYNSQEGFTLSDVTEIIAVWEGEYDGGSWEWLLKLKSPGRHEEYEKYALLVGWCDYTGWDCQSGAKSWISYSLDSVFESRAPHEAELRRQAAEGRILTIEERTEIPDSFGQEEGGE